MSDDEYYYDEFDEFHEMLYDADAEPDLADDLAAHVMHSPIWQDNPHEDLRDYFSDWEYYSDDYFDDDPKLLDEDVSASRSVKADGKVGPRQVKRGRKRKLSEVRDEPEQKRKEFMALTSCLQGTVWKDQSPEPGESFKIGIENPVALRLSEDIMKAAYNQDRGFGKRQLTRDESWANDLSLADMGLTADKTQSSREQNDETLLEENDEGDQDELEEEEVFEEEDDVLQNEIIVGSQGVDSESRQQAESDVTSRPKKRNKTNKLQERDDDEAALPTPDASLDSEGGFDGDEFKQPIPRRVDEKRHVHEKDEKQGLHSTTTQNRKRKLSSSESSAMASTASTRAKRIATESAAKPTAAASRPSRTRKK